MGFMDQLLGMDKKQSAFHTDALVLKEISPAGQDNEKIVHFAITPQKKSKNLYSLIMLDGSESKKLETDLPLQAALMLMKQRFSLKRRALDTLAQTIGTQVHIDAERIPFTGSFQWQHVRNIFNFVAEDVHPDILN